MYVVVGGLDTLLLLVGDTDIHEILYKGWNKDCYVRNVLVFAPRGTVITSTIKKPGAMHEYFIAEWGGVYKKLESTFGETGGCVAVKGVFSRGRYPILSNYAAEEKDLERLEEVETILQVNYINQVSQWGMRGLQGSFPRIKHRFTYEKSVERKNMMWVTVFL